MGPAPAAVRFAVLGPGGVGGLLAALLTRAGSSVVILASEQTASALSAGGLRIESRRYGDFEVGVRAALRLESPVDAVLVTVKATHLSDAIERVPAGVIGDGLVIPFLNGLDHIDLLREVYGRDRVVDAAIRIESTRTRPGLIRHASPFAAVEMGTTPANRDAVARIAAALGAAGIDVRLREDGRAVLWDKFVPLTPLALLTTHERANVGVVRTKRRDDCYAIVRELTTVAAAEGVAIDPDAVMRFIDGLPEAMETSMQRDDAAGRPLELDALGGAALRRAAAHAIEVPVTRRIVEELEARTQ
jgi:2-dehydropantoate 2-reductase